MYLLIIQSTEAPETFACQNYDKTDSNFLFWEFIPDLGKII